MNNENSQMFLGIDGGGTKCKAVLVNKDLTVLGEGLAGPANPYRDLNGTKNAISECAQQAIAEAGLNSSVISSLNTGVGLAGVSDPHTMKKMQKWRHPFASMKLTTDLHIALYGAHLSEQGAAIIAGTGSSGIAVVDDGTFIHGGHGFPHGDIGGGAWIGRRIFEAVLLDLDTLGAPTQLTSLLLKEIDAKNSEDIVDYLNGANATRYASLAPLLFKALECEDRVAEVIIGDAVDYLSGLAKKLWAHQPGKLTLIGSLGQRLLPWFNSDISALFSSPLKEQEVGAAWWVIQHTRNAVKGAEIAALEGQF